MKFKTRGIALHTLDYSDSSVIIRVLTRDFGIRSYIVKGASGKRSKTRIGLFQPLNLLEMEVSNSGKEKLEMIYEARNFPVYQSIQQNIYKSCIAQFLAEFLMKSLKEENVDESMFSMIEDELVTLDHLNEDYGMFHLFFLLKLSKYMGFYPSERSNEPDIYFDLNHGVFTSRTDPSTLHADRSETLLLYRLMNGEPDTLKLTREERKRLLALLIRYFEQHVPTLKDLKSVKVLEEVLE